MAERGDNYSKFILAIVGTVVMFAVIALVLNSQRPQEVRVGAQVKAGGSGKTSTTTVIQVNGKS